MYIYLLRNTVNGKTYIGKTTKTPEKRFRQHVESSKQKRTYLQRSINKHGEDKFMIEVLEVVQEKSLLDSKEIYWIAKLEPEYNMTPGGEGGNTTGKYTEERKRERSIKSSASIKKMWDHMSEDERKQRMEKTHSKTDYNSYSEKLSISRRRYFANETEEERNIRIEKAKMGSKKIKSIQCSYCSREIGGGEYNLKRHEQACSKNPSSNTYRPQTKKKQPYIYTIIDPNNITHTTNSFRGFCENHNLSRYLLMKNIGKVVESVDERTNNANAITMNTFGWCLLRVVDLA
jgi:group I intron endonuclease